MKSRCSSGNKCAFKLDSKCTDVADVKYFVNNTFRELVMTVIIGPAYTYNILCGIKWISSKGI